MDRKKKRKKENVGERSHRGGRRLWALALFTAVFFLMSSITVLAGWVETPEWRYLNEDGSFKRSEWFQNSNGNWYYFDDDARMVTGLREMEDGTVCFFSPDGNRLTGLIELNGQVFYFDEDGTRFLGEKIVNGSRYLFAESGVQGEKPSVPSKRHFVTDGEGKLSLERKGREKQTQKESLNLAAFTALLIGPVLFLAGRRRKDRRELFILYLAVLFASTPLFLPYFYRSQDLEFHLNRIMGISASLQNGMFPVRLNAFTFNGYGYAEPVFYPSLFLYFPGALTAMGMPLVDSVNVWLLFVNLATAASMYYAAGHLFHSHRIGCISSIFYTLGIYRLTNLYTRAAFGELTAMIFFPIVLYGLYEVIFRDEKKWWILVLGLTGVVQSHIISTLFAAAGCILCSLVCIKRVFVRERFWACVKAAVFSLFLNLWFFVPLLEYMKAGMDLFSLQFPVQTFTVTLAKLLEIYPISMGASPLSYGGAFETMAVGLGLPILAGIALYFYQAVDGKRCRDKKVNVLLAAGIVLSLCATCLFPWETLVKNGFFRWIASYIQFPWRFLCISLCFFSLTCAWTVYRQWGEKYYRYTALAVLLLCVLSSQHLLEGYYQSSDYIWRTEDVDSMISQREYLYSEVDKQVAYGAELPSGEELEITDSVKDGLSVNVFYESKTPGAEVYLDMPLYYYPGYYAEDENGSPLPVVRSEKGLARVVFPAESRGQIAIWFRGRKLWRLCEFLSAGAAILFAGAAGFWRGGRKRIKNSGCEQ